MAQLELCFRLSFSNAWVTQGATPVILSLDRVIAMFSRLSCFWHDKAEILRRFYPLVSFLASLIYLMEIPQQDAIMVST